MWWEGHFISGIFLTKAYNPSLIMRNKTNPSWRTFYRILTSNLQNCEGHQKQGKSEKLSEPSKASEEMTTKSNAEKKEYCLTVKQIWVIHTLPKLGQDILKFNFLRHLIFKCIWNFTKRERDGLLNNNKKPCKFPYITLLISIMYLSNLYLPNFTEVH